VNVELIPVDELSVVQLISMMQAYYEYEQLEFNLDNAHRAALQLVSDERLGRIWFIAMDQKLVGYLAITFGFSLEFGGKDAFMDEFFIYEGHRHHGIGRTALLLAEQILREQNIQAVHLEVDRENSAAKSFYHSMGFENRERFHLMSKKL
jgi:ribosomal protein S18 acetylase RimI-like enzyme